MAYGKAGMWGPEVVLNGSVTTPLPLPATSITVRNMDGSAATLYTDRTAVTTTSNVILTDAMGQLTFFAMPGQYKLHFTNSLGAQMLPITVNLDPADLVPDAFGTGIFATVTEGPLNPTRHGAVLDGVADDAAAWNATVAAAKAALLTGHSNCGVQATGRTKIASTVTIDASIMFGGSGASRGSNDNSDPTAGLEFIFTGTSGDAIFVQPPNAINSRISPNLHDFLIRGNRNIGGATAGGGLKIDGRNLAGTAVSGFVLDNVHVAEAKEHGLTIDGNVYEGRVSGLHSADNAGRGVSIVPTAGIPGEILWFDMHCHDNLADGFYASGGSSYEFLRISASRNALTGVTLSGCQFACVGVQLESNVGNAMLCDSFVRGSINGLFVAYPNAGGVAHGLAISGASGGGLQATATYFQGTTTGKDIIASGAADGILVNGYVQSAASKVTLPAGSQLISGNTFTKKATFADDVTLSAGAGFFMGTVFAIGSDGRPKWVDAGNVHLTVGAAGAAAAPPATPSDWLEVRIPGGTVRRIAAYPVP